MKRELVHNVKVFPYTSGTAIDKSGFASGVLGVTAGADGDLILTITHSDDGASFETVTDTGVFFDSPAKDGAVTLTELSKSGYKGVNMDLSGLKDFVKVEASGAAAAGATYAVALGDAGSGPVSDAGSGPT